jgi:hypothetical protein
MQEAGLPSIKAIDMSVSIGRGKSKVVILDDQLVPDEFCRIVREPHKILIAVELNAGREVAGATLGNPQQFITIHRS